MVKARKKPKLDGLARTSHLHHWAMNRPFVVGIIAQQAVGLASAAQMLVDVMRSGLAARKVRSEGLERDWLDLYRKPRQVKREAMKFLFPNSEESAAAMVAHFLARRNPYATAQADAALDGMSGLAQSLVKTFAYWLWRSLYLEHCEFVATVLNDEDAWPHLDIERDMGKPELQFFALVMVPALLEYGESATRLYSRARRGDPLAIDQLLRVDKSAMNAPGIREHVKRFGMERELDRAGIVADAYAGQPQTSQTALSVKARLASYAIGRARSFGCKLGPADMRDAFDAYERDRTGDAMAQDRDMPDDSDAWRQAVQRAKPFFEEMLRRDAKYLPGRHGDLTVQAVISDFDESERPPAWIDYAFRQQAISPVGWVNRLRRWRLGKLANRQLRLAIGAASREGSGKQR